MTRIYSNPMLLLGFLGILTACAPGSGAPPAEPSISHEHGEHEHGANKTAEREHGEHEHAEHHAEPGTRESAPPAADSADVERAAYDKAKPVFDAFCAQCHASHGGKGNQKALGHFNMDRYPFAGHHAAEITSTVREVLGVTGSPPTMPRDKPGAVKGEELSLILAWADAYDQARSSKAAATPHGDHDHGQ